MTKKSESLFFQSVLDQNPTENTLYRYRTVNTAIGVKLSIEEFQIVKHTPKGIWITPKNMSFDKRFVLLKARKKYAHFTQEEALESFVARTSRRVQLLKNQLANSELALLYAKQLMINLYAKQLMINSDVK